MNETHDIAARITAVRKALHLKQKDFAERLGVSGASLSEIESGKYKPNHDFLVNISKEYNVNLYFLLFGEGDMFLEPVNVFTSTVDSMTSHNADVKEFLSYFERSPLVRYTILGTFRSLLLREKESIDQEIAAKDEG